MIKITSQMLTYHLYFCIFVGQIIVALFMAGGFWLAFDYFNKMYDKVFKK